MKTSRSKQACSLVVLLGFLLSSTACIKSSTPPSPWEEVTTYNATFAEANQAIEAGTQALVASGVLTPAKAQPVITWSLKTAEIHQQITAALGTGSSITSANVAQITSLLQQLQASANTLIASGTLNITNPKTQNQLAQDIAGVVSAATLILNLLPQLQANPAPSTTPAAPAKGTPQ
jgi:hypothetical protein